MVSSIEKTHPQYELYIWNYKHKIVLGPNKRTFMEEQIKIVKADIKGKMNFSHMLVGTSNPVRVAQCGETPWVIESEDRLVTYFSLKQILWCSFA